MKVSIAIAASAIFASANSMADEATVKALVLPKLGGQKVLSVSRITAGIYEVVTDRDIVYTDSKAKYILAGKLFDADTKSNLTEIRQGELNKVDFASLPLQNAIKVVRGNGEKVVVVFEDPNCGYCKKLRKNLQQVDNVTIYTFLYNILTEDSEKKSRDIWCSADRAKTWDDWMLLNKAAKTAHVNCQTPNESNLALGKQLRITATPTLIFADGARIPGAVDAAVVEKKFSTITNN